MAFKFSARSKSRLEGVDPRLVSIAISALARSPVDFGITCGLRTAAEQRELHRRGATRVRRSRHQDGAAIDVAAWVGGKFVWDQEPYVRIADAFAEAAADAGVAVRWGGAWTVPDVREWAGRMGAAQARYVAARKRQGKRPWLDAVHFELPRPTRSQ